MSSTFVSVDKLPSDSKKLFADSRPKEIYLQFTPGQAFDIVTSSEHVGYGGMKRNINSVFAKPHYGSTWTIDSAHSEEFRYYSMFRGMVDVPMKGDPLLLCTIGQVQYYLGPLNTLNRPDWNIDHLNIPNPMVAVKAFGEIPITNRDLMKISKNFQVTRTARLEKKYNEDLDNPDKNKKAINDIHGDLVFEGRHGSSIRIGSRDLNPYIFLSNGRPFQNVREGIADGSFISMTEKGTLQQHFGSYGDIEKEKPVAGFQLGDSTTEAPKRTSSQLVSFVNGNNDATDIIYGYGGNQTLIHSDRIIFNSKKDDIFMSSIKDIHIGSGNNLTVSVENGMIIEAGNIYLGKHSKTKNESDEQAEPLVLGEQLRLILEEMVGILEIFKVTGTAAGISGTPAPDVVTKLQALKSKLSQTSSPFFSQYHFIENNGQQNK